MKRYIQVKCYRFDDRTLDILKKNIESRNEQLADRNKMNEAAYIRDLIHRDNMDNIGIDRAEFIGMNKKLAGMGNNLNQIAHRLNSNEYSASYIEVIDELIGLFKRFNK